MTHVDVGAHDAGVTAHAAVFEERGRHVFIGANVRGLRQAVESVASTALSDHRHMILANDLPAPIKSDAWPEIGPAPSAYEATVPILSKHDQEVQTLRESDAKGGNVEEAAVQVGRGRSWDYDTHGKLHDKTR